MTLITAFTSL